MVCTNYLLKICCIANNCGANYGANCVTVNCVEALQIVSLHWLYPSENRLNVNSILNSQVETDAHTHMKNGKKICWNYRKGRCRFGSNCQYAHDSDLHVAETNAIDKESTQATMATNIPISVATGTITSKTSNKKRLGLGDSIVPSKKVIKAYNALKK